MCGGAPRHIVVRMLAHRGPRLSRVVGVACAVLLGCSLVGCGSLHALGLGSSASPTSTPRPHRTNPPPPPRPPPPICPAPIAPGFSCVMQQRITEVEGYLATQPGHIGIVLHDRVSGATWRNAEASAVFPAASTIKLAMVLDVMLRNRAGTIQLGDDDWALIDAILSESSDTAADQLWGQFEGSSFLGRIRAFGMTSAS